MRGIAWWKSSQEALEAQFRRDLAPDEAIAGAVSIARRLTALATRLPPDDGRIHITRSVLMGDGLYGEEREDEKEG